MRAGLSAAVAPIVPSGLSARLRYILEAPIVMPIPTLVDGKPVQPWQPIDLTYTNWGRFQVLIDGIDHTFTRDIPCIVDTYSFAEPFGESAASIIFPQFTQFDVIGEGTWSFLKPWSTVDIVRVKEDGSTEVQWEGIISAFEDSYDETKARLKIVCMGALHQVSTYVRSPAVNDRADDIGWDLMTQFGGPLVFGSRAWLKCHPGVPVTTGLFTRYRGAWESVTDYIQTTLDKYGTDTNGGQWTVYNQHPRTPKMKLKNRGTTGSTNWTITAGAPGVKVQAQRELASEFSVFFGEGQDIAGATWRNTFPQNELGNGQSPYEVFYEPLDYDPLVHTIDVDANHNLVVNADRLDTDIPRIESYTSYGQGVNFEDAVLSAKGQRQKFQSSSNWAGHITLTSDPEEGSLLGIREGHNLILKRWHSDGTSSPPYDEAFVRALFANYGFTNNTLIAAAVWVTPATETGPQRVARILADLNYGRRSLAAVTWSISHLPGASAPVGTVLTEEDQWFHVAEVSFTIGEKGRVSANLTVDTIARDVPTLAAVLQRNREIARSGIYPLSGRMDGNLVRSRSVPWDTAAGSGTFPNSSQAEDYAGGATVTGAGHRYVDGTSVVHCLANQWSIIKVLASERDNIARTEITSSVAAPFHASVYNIPPDPLTLPSNPFAPRVWEMNAPANLLIGWGAAYYVTEGDPASGTVFDRAGFSPGNEPAGDPATGVLVDETTFSYSHDNAQDRVLVGDTIVDVGIHNAYIFVAIWPTVDADFYGVFTKGPFTP